VPQRVRVRDKAANMRACRVYATTSLMRDSARALSERAPCAAVDARNMARCHARACKTRAKRWMRDYAVQPRHSARFSQNAMRDAIKRGAMFSSRYAFDVDGARLRVRAVRRARAPHVARLSHIAA